MKLLLLLLAVALPWVSDSTHLGLPTAAEVASPTLSPQPPMWADRSEVFVQDTIWLRFQVPHPPFLGVLDPEGKFFYIVFPAHEAIGALIPLADSKSFVGMSCLAIPTSLKADPYQYGVLENRPVFTMFGVYTFIMGDNLHTDDPTENHQIEIAYRQTPPKVVSH
jgi:hypothetical protein